ncbi:MAG: SDR family oxidoreductase [bacterium]
MPFSFKNKTAVITGASSGLGAEFARRLAREGARLVLAARRKNRLEALKQELNGLSDFIHVIEADLSREQRVEEFIAELERLPHPVEILINNAGFGMIGAYDEADWNRLDELYRLDMITLARLSRWAGETMRKRGSGRILNVASTASFQPLPYMAAYGAAKAFVSSLSLALYQELKPSGVMVSCLYPGKTETEFFEAARMSGEKFANQVSSMPADRVVRVGLEGLRRGDPLIIPGFFNKMVYHLSKVSPKKITLALTEGLFK